ncbi:MAG: hypothetical protein Q8P18_08270 [Pseudomonadota bacterium]|nr:hypothetical protein [Pseudomonadota bacterium]
MPILSLPLLLAGCGGYHLVYEKTTDTGPDTGLPVDTDTDTQTDTDTDTDSGTDTDTDTEDTDTEDTAPAVCGRILVYSTEGTSGAGRALGLFAGLTAEPTLAAWEVDVWERAEDGLLTEAVASGYSQLWIMATDKDFGTALDFTEVRVVRDFVDAGGGLLLAAGPTDGTDSYGDDVNLVAELYGVEFDGAASEGADGAPLTVRNADPVLLAGITELPGFTSVSELTVTDAAVQVAATIAGSTALAYRDDGQRIVFDRAFSGWGDTWRAEGDQAALVGNVAGFLEPCGP